MFNKHLLHIYWIGSRLSRYTVDKTDKSPCPYIAYIILEETDIQKQCYVI